MAERKGSLKKPYLSLIKHPVTFRIIAMRVSTEGAVRIRKVQVPVGSILSV